MILTIVVFFLVLSVLVFVHELGHFYCARKFGVKAGEFGFGFPPRICGWQRLIDETKKIKKWRFIAGNKNVESLPAPEGFRSDTVYSLNWIPMGGFVNIKGENGDFQNDPDSFGHKKIWKRAVILSAGVFMNVVLGIVCLIFAFIIGAPQIIDKNYTGAEVKNEKIQIMSVLPDSPAAKAGLKMGDAIVSVDNVVYNNVEDVKNLTAKSNGKEISLKIDRYGTPLSFKLKPEILPKMSEPAMGASLAKTGVIRYPWYKAIWLGIISAYSMFIQIIAAFAMIIKNAVIGQPIGADVAGPVGIAVMTGQMARLGFVYILQFTALLSMNLAIINFLPFPALDGGRVLFL
ncbi:MAG: site-2 protease family protein, partial [Parcubacteria group bacterium]